MPTEQDIIALRSRVAELERRLDFLYKKLGVEYIDNPGSIDSRIIEILKRGNKIEAIKIYRELTDAGLAEAKQAVDSIEARLGL